MSEVSYYFLPWVRYGLWKNAQNTPELGRNSFNKNSLVARVEIPIQLDLNNTPIEGIQVSIFGPGDIIGIDSREVIRTEPPHLANSFLPHHFPFIEFDRPDFPWLFTPGKQDNNDCLMPWIVLAVLPKEEATLVTNTEKSTTELTCDVKNLPDLSEAWAWAHAQYIGASKLMNLSDKLADQPHQNVSRLMCARRLKPNCQYIACVVPVFKPAVNENQAETTASNLESAWKLASKSTVTVPVYYHWQFSTAPEGDFEDFISKLKKPAELAQNVQETFFRRMDISTLASPQDTLEIISALEISDTSKQNAADEAILAQVKDQLKARLISSQSFVDNVPLPIYGSWHTQNASAAPNLDDATVASSPWIKTLNTDPRYRVAAALGTQIIQRQQEQLMAAAWEQVSGIDLVNQKIKQKQLALSVTNAFFKRIDKLTDDTFMKMTKPVATAIAYAEEKVSATGSNFATLGARNSTMTTTTQSLSTSYMQSAERHFANAPNTSTAYRRMLRPQGNLSRRSLTTEQLNGSFDGTAVLNVQHPSFQKTFTHSLISGKVTTTLPMHTSVVSDIRQKRMALLNPDETFRAEMRARIQRRDVISNSSPQQPILTNINDSADDFGKDPLQLRQDDHLSFPQPMSESLREMFQEMLIPGLDQIPNNSLVILKANSAFIEAFLVGLNHELSRELLWREYPTPLGSTYFKKFWNDQGSGKSMDDIPDIKLWTNDLGKNLTPDRSDLWMLLIKGDLLIRYPDTIIYAQDSNQKTLLPAFRVNPIPGVTMLGFSINFETQGTGWKFVLEEHPTETRFGLDISSSGLKTWRDLSWPDMVMRADESGYLVLQPETEAEKNKYLFPDVDQSKVPWAKNSACMAYITLQKPFRYEIPSEQWFPPTQ